MDKVRDHRPVVGIGLVGTTLDAGQGSRRWERWRPTVSLFQREDTAIARFELLHGARYTTLAKHLAADIVAVSPETEVVLHLIDDRDPWDLESVYGTLMDFVSAYPFRDDEQYWAHITTGSHVAQICLFLLVEAGFLPGRLAQTSPPRGSSKEPGLQIIDLHLQRYDAIARRFAARRDAAVGFLKGGIATRNVAFNALIDRIERVALGSTAPILLTGPTGAGKSRLARRVYELKKVRRQVDGPFVEVNCATIRGDGAMSALFGHVRGAFTGADAARKGLLLTADKGVLFLDEVGELGLDEQAMLLRAIEEKRFSPYGSDREVASDFQLLAGTNRDLRAAVAAGTFRDDLHARIDLWTFRLPGLAERPEDVEPNLDWELDEVARKTARRVRFNREARERFLAFARHAPWPANFRDLSAAVTRMATLSDGGRIDVACVDDEIGRLSEAWEAPRSASRVDDALGEAALELDRFDAVQLEDVLAVCASAKSLSHAGRALFAASRARKASTNDADRLRKYLARFGLGWADVGP